MLRYWREWFLFGIIFAVYMVCCQPSASWAGYCCDLGDFLYSSKFMTTLHFPGYPMYAVLSWMAVRIPIGEDGFRLALLLSVIPAVLTCILVFYSVKKQTNNGYAPYVASLSLAGANIFLMQSIIAEVYVLTAFLAVATYTMIVYERWRLSAIFAALTITMHPLLWPAILAFMVWKRKLLEQYKIYIPIVVCLYLFSWIMGHFMGSLSMFTTNFWGFVQYILGTVGSNVKWWFSLPLWKIHEKLYSIIVVFVVAFGLALIPMIRYMTDWRKSGILLAVVAVPLVYFVGCTIDLTVLHLSLAAPFLAIAAGLGISKLKTRHFEKVVVICSLALLVTLPLGYDIGRTLDKSLSASKSYAAFDSLPDNAIVVNLTRWENSGDEVYGSISGRERSILHTYIRETEKDIVNVNIDGYTSDIHATGIGIIGELKRKELRDSYGMNTPYVELDGDIDSRIKFWLHIELIAEENPDRLIYYSLIPENDSLCRDLVKYKTVLLPSLWKLSLEERAQIMLDMDEFKEIGQ